MQGNQDPDQELLVLSLQGQRKAVDDAEEGTGERRRAQVTGLNPSSPD